MPGFIPGHSDRLQADSGQRILVFSSTVAKHCFSSDSSGLDFNLIILETSQKSGAR